jgi:hypothetical protein
MTKKVTVTEKLRKEIRAKIADLEPDCKWYLIPRDQREEGIEWAYLRVNEEGKAESYSDDGVTSHIYQKCMGMKAIAERNIEWLESENLWMGARFMPVTEEYKEELRKQLHEDDDECK